MTHLQITPEHPSGDQRDEPATDGTTTPELGRNAPALQVELERAADEGMIAPPDDELTQPSHESGES